MEITLRFQKTYFETKRTINDIMDTCPFLLEKKYFYNYFQFIMKVQLQEFNRRYKLMTPLVEIKLMAAKYLPINSRTDIDSQIKAFEMISLYFGEKSSQVYNVYQVI